MRDLNWFEPGSPLEVNEIEAAEEGFGVKLPRDYVEFVLVNSGGSNPDESVFEYLDQGKKRVGNFGVLLSLSAEDEFSVFATLENLSGQLPDKVIPVVGSGSGDYVCLDFRGSDLPGVVYFLHERSGDFALVPLASSFSAFLDRLQEPEDE
ncbi:SMI1/KNR4 family protein [Solimonas sp. SE-A11]|uniref:SMI1/KNR4 family protein n=1 Tax=Solimonas sp. SE-A11 TaxID=3054954 RepID=UPI00259CA266|nr:SMI1/KNR4 family protein [Solimonas sp. SE-A11]MDM4772897.1 SMI1/KNR4 family protein [Solimonas sp. SE-A11]